MTETEFTRALRETATTGAPPLALDAAGMVERARRTRRRHRAGLAVGTSALTAAALTAAVLLVPAGRGGTQSVGAAGPGGSDTSAGCNAEGRAQAPGAPEPATTSPPPAAGGQACPGGPDTQSPWPSGQSDRTAHSGVHAEAAQRLLTGLVGALPAGYRSSAPWQQGEFDHLDGRTEVWEYAASVEATKAGRVGVLLAVVFSPAGGSSTDLCKLAEYFYGPPATGCHIITVGGKQVAVARHPEHQGNVGYSPDLDQWAVYRHPDGTVVRIGQAKSVDHGPALRSPLFTETQLATLAIDPRLR